MWVPILDESRRGSSESSQAQMPQGQKEMISVWPILLRSTLLRTTRLSVGAVYKTDTLLFSEVLLLALTVCAEENKNRLNFKTNLWVGQLKLLPCKEYGSSETFVRDLLGKSQARTNWRLLIVIVCSDYSEMFEILEPRDADGSGVYVSFDGRLMLRGSVNLKLLSPTLTMTGESRVRTQFRLSLPGYFAFGVIIAFHLLLSEF